MQAQTWTVATSQELKHVLHRFGLRVQSCSLHLLRYLSSIGPDRQAGARVVLNPVMDNTSSRSLVQGASYLHERIAINMVGALTERRPRLSLSEHDSHQTN